MLGVMHLLDPDVLEIIWKLYIGGLRMRLLMYQIRHTPILNDQRFSLRDPCLVLFKFSSVHLLTFCLSLFK